MDSYNGYKLKPKEYSIQPNDIIIRVKNGGPTAPTNVIGIAKEHQSVHVPLNSDWSTSYTEWRAIEIKPGSEARAGDTVYCIKDTGSCIKNDSFEVTNYSPDSNSLSPIKDHELIIGDITKECWSWSANNFVVLVKEELSTVSSEPTPVDSLQSFIDEVVHSYGPGEQPAAPTIKQQTNSKGKQMNSNLSTDILKLLTQTEQTDLEKAPSTYAFFYNNEGEYEGTARVANESEAKALLQKPEHLGYTMRIYSFSDEFTTQIPVVSTIKKTVVAKPARKPRVSKA